MAAARSRAGAGEASDSAVPTEQGRGGELGVEREWRGRESVDIV